jgi:radical SAM/Cys-rich protein
MTFREKSESEPKSLTALQLERLDDITRMSDQVPFFKDKLATEGLHDFKPVGLEIFQVNLGKLCNQACKHCHVDAGPNRTEIMDRQTMELCLEAINANNIPIVDITGGAPEMNPNFRWFVKACRELGKRVIVRCNLTIIFEADEYLDLPSFFAENQVEVVCSLPFYDTTRTDKVRGKGVFDASVKGLQMLNDEGYGKPGSNLILDLVYNPAGAFLPASQSLLEKEFKEHLFRDHGIVFNNLFTITNMPVSRFLDYLLRSENYVSYIENLVNSFNPIAAMGAMCRNMISVSWDGFLYDCDFNQMLDLKVNSGHKGHISGFDFNYLLNREIKLSQHCYGCTAGSGSSCGGSIA